MNSDNEINIKAGLDIDDIDASLIDLEGALQQIKEEVGGLEDASAYLEQFDSAVSQLAATFADSDPVFGGFIETLGNFASGNYLGGITAGIQTVGSAMGEHEKYVDSVNAAYEKLQTRIEPNGEFARSIVALNGTLAAAQAEGGSMEDALAERMEKIVEAKKKAAIRNEAGDGIYGALSNWAGNNSTIIVEALGLNKSLEEQAEEEAAHRKATSQGDRDLAAYNKKKADQEKAIKEEEEAWAKTADAADKREDQKNAKADEKKVQDYIKDKEKAEREKKELEELIEKKQKGLEKFDEATDKQAMQKDRQDQLKALNDDKGGDKGFTSAIESFDQMYKRISTAAAGTSDENKDRKHREELAKKREDLLQKFHDLDAEQRTKEREKLVDDLRKLQGTV